MRGNVLEVRANLRRDERAVRRSPIRRLSSGRGGKWDGTPLISVVSVASGEVRLALAGAGLRAIQMEGAGTWRPASIRFAASEGFGTADLNAWGLEGRRGDASDCR